jgi:glutamine amidotransferase PdxT
MKMLRYFILVSFLTITCLAFSAPAKTNTYALIYAGVNSCGGCPEAIADIARRDHISVKYVKNPNQIPLLLNHASIFIIGGTEDSIEMMRLSFNKKIISSIKKYVNHGGNYLGICGGGFIAAKYYMADVNRWVKGFNIIPARAVDYSETSEAHLENLRWKGKNVLLFFQAGPKFILEKDARNVAIIAHYPNGDIAALKYLYGKGKVVVVGPHPEADKTWLEEDGIDSSQWKPRQELIIDLFNEMLS